MPHLMDVTLPLPEVQKAIRLGKKRDDGSQRPLLIALEKPEKKSLIFKNTAKLKNTVYKDISLANDLTKLQREQNKKLREEAKEKNASESTGKYLYKVVGPPWARKVAKMEKEPKAKAEGGD